VLARQPVTQERFEQLPLQQSASARQAPPTGPQPHTAAPLLPQTPLQQADGKPHGLPAPAQVQVAAVQAPLQQSLPLSQG
jgi:hypothetical protein